ncbi:hypothetical protein LKD70_09205 [Ruminococcus sp. CLA-AA-H200]|uniref:Uncharacterized protein n=1 Tax=Ruminococcus turbiniformis TaxID=2881258 RepID=A0ABS8FX12_9FIRM|nr:hypothetical protein [Ruminococcus turbiniformis]MCC2254592.1 hypothetical protein [Ruminococcus turbiniformis]
MKFDIEVWEKKYQLFEENRKGMSAEVVVSLSGGKFRAEIKSMDPEYEKYKNNFLKVITEVGNGAMYLMYSVFYSRIIPESDKEAETKRMDSIYADSAGEFLHTLFEKGKDKFLEDVFNQAIIIDIGYKLTNMEYRNGTWIQNNGDIWDNGIWRSAAGDIYGDCLGDIMSVITGPSTRLASHSAA